MTMDRVMVTIIPAIRLPRTTYRAP
jgi:hypothetical protein